MAASELFGDFTGFSAAAMADRGSLKWSGGEHVIGAWVAEMDFGTAPAVTDVVRAAADAGTFGYLSPRVAAQAKSATRSWLHRRYDWDVPAETIALFPDVLTTLEATMAHVAPDGPLVVPTPAYMPFLTKPRLFGRRITEVPGVRAQDGRYRLDLAGIDAALAGGGLLVLCNPWNPVGRVLTREELAEVSAVVEKNDATVFADEIHAPIVLDEGARHVPYASLTPETAAHTVTATSTSKGFNVPGLKCAQLIAPAPAHREALAPWLAHYEHLASPLGAACTVAAYTGGDDWLAEVTAVLRHNRDAFAAALAAGAPKAVHYPAEGTYLAWVDLRPYAIAAPAEFLREHANVAVTDGAECGAPGFVRVNLAAAPAVVAELAARITAAVRDC